MASGRLPERLLITEQGENKNVERHPNGAGEMDAGKPRHLMSVAMTAEKRGVLAARRIIDGERFRPGKVRLEIRSPGEEHIRVHPVSAKRQFGNVDQPTTFFQCPRWILASLLRRPDRPTIDKLSRSQCQPYILQWKHTQAQEISGSGRISKLLLETSVHQPAAPWPAQLKQPLLRHACKSLGFSFQSGK